MAPAGVPPLPAPTRAPWCPDQSAPRARRCPRPRSFAEAFHVFRIGRKVAPPATAFGPSLFQNGQRLIVKRLTGWQLGQILRRRVLQGQLLFQTFPHQRGLCLAACPAFPFEPGKQFLPQFQGNRCHWLKVFQMASPPNTALPPSTHRKNPQPPNKTPNHKKHPSPPPPPPP